MHLGPTERVQIAKALGDDVSFVRDIRLVTRKGSSSFAFVEFYDAKDSARWMEKIEADPLYLCGSRVDVDYSRAQRDQWRDRNNESRDWVCFKCNTVNFSRRRFCMTCDCTRTESDQFHEDVRSGKDTGPRDDNAPSNVLIMKGLDVNSTESSIRGALASLEGLQQPVDVRIIRDHITSASRGFCFLEFSSGEITSMALRKMLEQTPAFFVDGRRITVTYARGNNPKSTGTHNVANAAIAQAQWSMSLAPQLNSSLGQTQTSQQQGAQWHQAPVQYSQPPASTQQDQSVHSTNQPASSSAVSTVPATSSAVASTTQEASDLPSTYSYDPTSGFYHDSSTGLYYDPKTQYHYNSKTGNYCFFDATQQAYIPVDSQGNPVATSGTTTSVSTLSAVATTADTQPRKAEVTKPLNAKKIAKDMERWAKTVNAAKASQKQQLKALIQLERAEVAVRGDTAGDQQQQLSLGTEVRRSGISLTAALEQDTAREKAALSTLAADVPDIPAGPTPSLPPGADSDPAHTDWAQLACLVCKRKFQSKEVLVKHQQFSDLHKKNLASLKQNASKAVAQHPPPPTEEPAAEMVYRDRAKERREKYGTPAVVPGWKKRLEREIDKAKFSKYEQPTVEGLKEDNLGNKMLQAMGWNEGQGLGKSNQGIVEPVKAEMRQVGAGLGARGSSHGLYSSAGTYRETLRQLTKSRYDTVFQE
ncbi:RNA-binding protein 5-A [Geodia barretti]|uniref:RNA-binding protein 5-A n=1 Tax=Geodia barretti TaxID=519541 RepID=A0AA35RS82_GEOBA|nr:RNA-binding protein 5-A [Geodia barretti]